MFASQPFSSETEAWMLRKRTRLSSDGIELCASCGENILGSKVVLARGPPEGALEEETALASDRLRLYSADMQIPDIDSKPQNKITQFYVFDREGHLCSFDGGLLERNVFLYFSGYIKPIYDEDSSSKNGVPAMELGPINEWWLSGFDEGDRFIIALTTPYGDYILMEPSPEYAPFMRQPMHKALLTKVVIEFLNTSCDPVYEELLSRLGEVSVPDGIEPLDENCLSKHAQFLTDQICAVDDEGSLLATPAMQAIINLYGTTLNHSVKKPSPMKPKISTVTTTPLISTIFDSFFQNSDSFSDCTKMCSRLDPLADVLTLSKSTSSFTWDNGAHMAVVNGVQVSVGDFVYVSETGGVFRVNNYFYRNFTKQVHCTALIRGKNTILGESSNPFELFFLDECKNWAIGKITKKISVRVVTTMETWQEGIDRYSEHTDLFVQKRYSSVSGTFADIGTTSPESCFVCIQKEYDTRFNTPTLDERIDHNDNLTLNLVRWRGEEYSPGCCIMFDPFVVSFCLQNLDETIEKSVVTVKVNEIIYPEIYRKPPQVREEEEPPEPCKLGYVSKIYYKTIKSRKQIFFTVNKFYRPENTHLAGSTESALSDMHLLYWSDEQAEIDLRNVKGKCSVTRSEAHPAASVCGVGFYFREAYDWQHKSFQITNSMPLLEGIKAEEVREVKLRTLNPFCGAGGLAEGLRQSGIADLAWAVEIDEPTASAFKLNHPNASVFLSDCNVFLRDVMAGKTHDELGKKYPEKGEVDLICGGPPCQGFSTMNRFTTMQYSQFKNSLIVTFLSICDYYRPKFIILENIKNFTAYKKSVVFKHLLGSLVAMGYQCMFGVFQAGSFGIPQSRRRLMVVAAAPGLKLPNLPQPTHAFSLGQLDVIVDGRKYGVDNVNLAPLRAVTIWDAFGDLPPIDQEPNDYLSPSASSYQLYLRRGESGLKDHITKEVSPLNEARIKHIPSSRGCDWRDLPNLPIRLRDGTTTEVLTYEFYSVKNGNSKSGRARGVCSCASGKPCDPAFRQFNTLIPWHLPHTANRHNNWAGLYGRLDYQGFFSTTITNPEPSSKQGKVLHPMEKRIVSIRECARSQGLPDSFHLCGTTMEKYRQVGNAVPPPLAYAIGREIRKSILLN